MRTTTRIAAFVLVVLGAVAPVTAALAASDAGTTQLAPTITLVNPLKGVDCSSGNGNCLVAFLQQLLAFIIQIGVVVIILMVVYVGYKFVMAQGSETKLTEAKNMLLWTIVGALILLGAQAIASAIQATVTAISV